ncbi:STAS domain-containing protein [Oxynema aestuarii]|jgi:anti-anti-sigma factor|uniref:Anti-sigma factor antagonist n=1 Tax=Oxynema aestuarii AP17 TaxID=2064643 RepID=A0A6H1TWD7_9CYAN|nr:STAS domain-containing protein [Oxynema aestuarii]QIZ70073.1 STAS domain-containing protein [Oxynema aestuarii AP17]RMH76759.1 MAG: anti-sigma factor antagonist [Cyanobacteria bacterium J007]
MSSPANFEVIRPTGILDATQASQLRREIAHCLEKETEIVLVNLEQVAFIDSSGLGALVSALKMVRNSGGALFICSINDQVRMLFDLTSMDRVFKIYENEERFRQDALDRPFA